MPTLPKRVVTAVGIVLTSGAMGAATGSLLAPTGTAQSGCEMDECGPSGQICITSKLKKSCDAIEGGCRSLDCVKSPAP